MVCFLHVTSTRASDNRWRIMTATRLDKVHTRLYPVWFTHQEIPVAVEWTTHVTKMGHWANYIVPGKLCSTLVVTFKSDSAGRLILRPPCF